LANICIVDDHEIVRTGIKNLLSKTNKYQHIYSVGTIKSMIQCMEHHQIDLVLLDLKLEQESGISAAIQIKKTWPNTKVCILSGFIEGHYATEVKTIGLEGYVLKNTDFNHLIKTIDQILAGEIVYDKKIESLIDNQTIPSKFNSFSKRQNDILNLLVLGKTNKEIGYTLDIQEKTVRNYLTDLYKKMNVSNRSEAVSCFLRLKRDG